MLLLVPVEVAVSPDVGELFVNAWASLAVMYLPALLALLFAVIVAAAVVLWTVLTYLAMAVVLGTGESSGKFVWYTMFLLGVDMVVNFGWLLTAFVPLSAASAAFYLLNNNAIEAA